MEEPPRVISLFAATGMRVDVREGPLGEVIFLGSDVSAGPRGYDYEYTIAADRVPALREALGGGPDADVLALIDGAREDILARGEIAWLRAHGIEGTLHSQMRS